MSKAKTTQPASRNAMRSGPANTAKEQPVRDGGTEDLMVQGDGGTLPLKGAEKPHYYSDSKKAARR